jgi:hypothetical protein
VCCDKALSFGVSDKTAIERQIAAIDRQIDQLMYELCGLAEEEIRIVEGEQK